MVECCCQERHFGAPYWNCSLQNCTAEAKGMRSEDLPAGVRVIPRAGFADLRCIHAVHSSIASKFFCSVFLPLFLILQASNNRTIIFLSRHVCIEGSQSERLGKKLHYSTRYYTENVTHVNAEILLNVLLKDSYIVPFYLLLNARSLWEKAPDAPDKDLRSFIYR